MILLEFSLLHTHTPEARHEKPRRHDHQDSRERENVGRPLLSPHRNQRRGQPGRLGVAQHDEHEDEVQGGVAEDQLDRIQSDSIGFDWVRLDWAGHMVVNNAKEGGEKVSVRDVLYTYTFNDSELAPAPLIYYIVFHVRMYF